MPYDFTTKIQLRMTGRVMHFFLTTLSSFFLFFPELRSSSCGNPGVPPKGILNGTHFNVGDKIRYRCVSGYVLDGHSLLTCVTNAASVSVWDFPVPICRGEEVFISKNIFLLLCLHSAVGCELIITEEKKRCYQYFLFPQRRFN